MKKRIALILCFVLMAGIFSSFLAGAASEIDQPRLDRIDAYIQKAMAAGKIPGLSLGIVSGDTIVYLKGYGEAGPDKAPVTAQTPFVLGSVSKTFTALAVRQLVNENKLDYNAAVITYIPWFTTADKSESDKMTINDLLNHTSGFSQVAGEGPYMGYKYSLEQLVRNLKSLKLDRPVGASEEYSNINYLVLGLVVQAVSGMPYEDYIQKNIYDPIGMENSFTSDDAALKNGLATGYRIVYGLKLPLQYTYPTGNLSHGFLISSAEDMSKYMTCYLSNGYYQDRSVIPNNTLSPKTSPSTNAADEAHYRTYWDIGQDDIGYYGHGGVVVNYSSDFRLSQHTGWGVVILTNVNNYYYEPDITAETICSGVISILDFHGEQPVKQVHASRDSIIMMAAFLAALLLLIVRAYWLRFFTAGIKAGKARRAVKLVSMVVIDFLLPTGVIIYIYAAMPISIIFALSMIPEQVLPVSLTILVLYVIGIIKLVKLLKGRLVPHHEHLLSKSLDQ